MSFQEIAKVFGMSNIQFAEAIGYRRQSLYQGIRKTAKAREAIERLKDLSDQMLEMDIEAAHRKSIKRMSAIREFELSIKERGHDG
jgi:hypothetical protein